MQKIPFHFILLVFLMNACVEREFLNQFDPKVPKTLSTSVSPSGSGQINSSPSFPNYQTGEIVTLNPVPSQHWVFQKWDGDVSGSAVPLSLTMDSNKSVVAVFVKKDYPLSITIQGEGTVTEAIVSNPSGREYPHGTVVRLTPVPQQGWIFDSWAGDLIGTESPKNITVDQEKNVIARFIRPAIASLACSTASANGVLTVGLPANGVTSAISYTGGNGSAHSGQTVPSSGVTGLTATLAPGTFANGSGTLTYVITGIPSGTGTANFAINIGNQTCTLSRTVSQTGTISTLNCDPSYSGKLTFGIPASGVSVTYSYSGGNGGPYNGQTITSSTIPSLTATTPPGNFAAGNGTLTFSISGTPPVGGASDAIFNITVGGKSCVLNFGVELPVGTIGSLDCSSVSNTGTLTSGSSASGVSFSIPYSGGNGGIHDGQVVNSTGVNGLTATLNSNFFANGSGSLIYNITGTPTSSGTANFAINIGGRTCTVSRTVNAPAQATYPAGSVFCASGPTAVVEVVSVTGKIWMDRNLGATRAAISSTDTQAYGDLYQWGRRSDGHQCRNSGTTTVLSSTDQPSNGNFIITFVTTDDWRSPSNSTLWQGVSGTNNPCPTGYRTPSISELNAERATWGSNNLNGAISSNLKLPVAGTKTSSGNISDFALYWSSSINGNQSQYLTFSSSSSGVFTTGRSNGGSVRCIKN
jgi:uncharacterized protein (TIGR02145 family)